YVYVVDHHGQLIYHPNPDRIGENVAENKVVQRLLQNESGTQIVTNTESEDYLASFAPVENTKWGIVSQTPLSQIDQALQSVFWQMVTRSSPLLFGISLLGLLVATIVTKPINKLANYSEEMMH